MKKTVKQIVDQYRKIKQTIKQSTVIRLTATDSYIRTANNKYVSTATVNFKNPNFYHASMKYAEVVTKSNQLISTCAINNTNQHLKIDLVTKSEINQLKKDTAAAVRTMNEKTAEQKTLESRFTAEVKRCTLKRESEKYAAAFKAALKSVVVAEYKDSLKNRKSKIHALNKK